MQGEILARYCAKAKQQWTKGHASITNIARNRNNVGGSINFDMRLGRNVSRKHTRIYCSFLGLFTILVFLVLRYLYKEDILAPVVRETAKVTSMVLRF